MVRRRTIELGVGPIALNASFDAELFEILGCAIGLASEVEH